MIAIYGRQGKLETALAECEKALAKRPENEGLLMTKATLLDALGRKKEAEEVYRKLIELNPKFFPALNNLAWRLAEEGELEEAFIFAQRARELAPENPYVLDTFAWILYKRGSNEMAISIFQDILNKNPDFGPVRYHLAQALLASGRKDEAIKELEKVVKSPLNFPEKEEARKLLAKLKKS